MHIILPIHVTPAPPLEGAPTMDPNSAARKAHDIDIDSLQAVPAETFLQGKTLAIALPGTGSNGCAIPAAADAPFPFGIDAAYSDGEHFTLEYYPNVGFKANATRMLRFGDNYAELLPGQKVPAGGFTVGRPDHDAGVMGRGAHAAAIVAGAVFNFSPIVSFQRYGEQRPNTIIGGRTPDRHDYDAAPEGFLCGFKPLADGGVSVPVALANNTDCDAALTAISQYFQQDRATLGDEHSPVARNSPDGWRCDISFSPCPTRNSERTRTRTATARARAVPLWLTCRPAVPTLVRARCRVKYPHPQGARHVLHIRCERIDAEAIDMTQTTALRSM